MQRLALASSGAAVAGLAAGWLLGAGLGTPTEPARPAPAAEVDVARLKAELEEQHAQRQLLANEVDRLQALLDDPARRGLDAREPDTPKTTSGSTPRAGSDAGDAIARDAGVADVRFLDDAIYDLGVDSAEGDRIRSAWRQHIRRKGELAMKFEPPQIGGPRHGIQEQYLDQKLHREIGDAAYEATKHAAGEGNRVVIEFLREKSPLYAGGARAGDEVISVDGQRVLLPIEFDSAFLQGKPGRTVVLEVLRNGQLTVIEAESGAPGARLGQSVSRPYVAGQ